MSDKTFEIMVDGLPYEVKSPNAFQAVANLVNEIHADGDTSHMDWEITGVSMQLEMH